MCEKVAVMYTGQIVEFGEIKSLLESPEHPYNQALLACTPRLEAKEKVLGGIPGTPPPPGQSGDGAAHKCRQEHARRRGATSRRTAAAARPRMHVV